MLRLALRAFTDLQHVQILRLQDEDDEDLLRKLTIHENTGNHVVSQWGPACFHSTRTLGTALLDTRSPFSRFSSPMLHTYSVEMLAVIIPREVRVLCNRLTSLELHFDEGELEERIQALSEPFQSFFGASMNLQAIHLGFPSHRPISIPLEEFFHNMQWKRLVAFGIQGWKLDAEEIIGLVGRHRERLRGLRLRDVFLNEGSMWKDVLTFLRTEMPSLDWVSLRRINYTAHFDQLWSQSGIEIPDDLPGGTSDSDEDEDEASTRSDEADDEESQEESESESDVSNGSDHGRHTDRMEFPEIQRATGSQWCTCGGHGEPSAPLEEHGDNGISVSNMQRKLWEKWVVKRCALHDA